MEINLITTEEVKQQLAHELHCDLESDTAIAELLRLEVFARYDTTRRAVCDAVHQHLEPFRSIEKDLVKDVFEELERKGDFNLASRGRVAPAPLRAVSISTDRFAFFGGIPTSRLRSAFGEDAVISQGVQREVRGFNELEGLVDECGGRIVSAEAWAGFDRSPPSGVGFIEELDERYTFEDKISSRGWDDHLLQDWQSYSPADADAPEKQRWPYNEHRSSLWRAWHVGGWFVYAWCTQGMPNKNDALKLSRDEAVRGMYSLDISQSMPRVFWWEAIDDQIEFHVKDFIPLAEYRYLSLHSVSRRDQKTRVFSYRIISTEFEAITKQLSERLGVQFRKRK